MDEAAVEQAFVIRKAGKPMVRVVPLDQTELPIPTRRGLGLLEGHCSVPDDFDQLGAEELANLFEGL